MPHNLTRAAGPARLAAPAPDPAFAALPRLTRLRNALAAARRRPAPPRGHWGEPPVFFFDRVRQAEYLAARIGNSGELTSPGSPRSGPDPYRELAERIAAELPDLFASVEVRRAARAVTGLHEAAASLAPYCPAAKDLADLLAVPDDEVVLVLHPALRAGFRVVVRGVADVAQFHLLLLDAATGDPADGFLPGPPLPARFRAAARNANPVLPAGVPMVAEARFQLFRPSAVRPDGSVPGGFRGCDHWLWGHEPLAAVPRVDGERVVLLGDPAYRATWEVERRFPAMAADAELVQVLGPFQVAERLGRLAGRPVPVWVPEPRIEGAAKAA
jgi:hypothetical protein